MDALKESLKEQIAQDVYKGYELSATKKLLDKLPKGLTQFDDLLAWMRVYSLEAAELYSPNMGTQFATFLYRHLQIRSFQELNCAWLSKNQPQAWIFNFSTFQVEPGCNESYDPTFDRDTTCLPFQIRDLLGKLSDRSSQLLGWMLDVVADGVLGAGLIAAFKDKRRVAAVRRYTGCTGQEIRNLLTEVRKYAPACIDGFED